MSHKYTLYKIADLEPGQHLCWIYRTEEDHRTLVTPYLRQGLERGEKVLYIVDTHSAETILEYLQDDGVEVEPYLTNGQLNIISTNDAYVRHGVFDPHKVIDTMWSERGRALAEGYPALRITSEMTWVLGNPTGSKRLIEYESELNKFFPAKKGFGNCLAICQYDQRYFKPDLLLDVLTTHPVAIVGTEVLDNFYYLPPKDFLSADRAAAILNLRFRSLEERKTAEGQLRGDEERFRHIYKESPIGIALYDPNGRLVTANKACLDMFGVPDSAAIEGLNLFNNLNMTKQVKVKLGESKTVRFETTFDFSRVNFLNLFETSKSGLANLDVLVTELGRGKKGFKGGYLVNLQDITKHKREEQILQKSEDRFRSVIEVASDAIISCESGGNIISWNSRAEIMFEYSSDAVMGKPLTFIMPTQFHKAFENQIKRLVSTKKTGAIEEVVEMTGLRKDGSEFPVDVSLAKWKAGGSIFFTAVIRDVTERRRTESELRIKDGAIASSINAIALVDLKGNITYVNPSFLRLWGYESEMEILGKPAILFWQSPSNAVKVLTTMPGKGWVGELLAEKRDGSTFDVQLSSSIITDGADKPVCMVASFVDITGRRQSDTTLQMGQERLSSFMQAATDSFTIWDAQLNLVELNEATLRFHPAGSKKEDLIGVNILDIIPSIKETGSHAQFLEVMKTGKPFFVDNVIPPSEFGDVYLSYSAFKVGDGLGIITTDRNRLEHDLKERVKQLQCLYGIASVAQTIDFSIEAICQEVANLLPSAWQYPEITSARITMNGKAYESENYQEDGWRQSASIEVYGNKVGTVEVGYSAEKPEMHEGPFSKEERELLDAVADCLRRIAERRQAETKLQKLYQQERELRRELDLEMKRRVEFTRVLVHEMKTRLTPVLASSELLVTEIKEEPWLSLVKNVHRGATNLNSRIDELLDLARGEIGMLKLKLGQVSLSKLLRGVVKAMVPVAQNHRQLLILDMADSLPMVRADEDRLRQVVLNLINNACKFTPEGGTITVRASEEGGNVVVEVQDNGPGITEEQRRRLFKPYHRIEADRESLSGLGLGLALSKALVELHQGRMWVSSSKGEGDIFGFSIPSVSIARQKQEAKMRGDLQK